MMSNVVGTTSVILISRCNTEKVHFVESQCAFSEGQVAIETDDNILRTE
jgi:hypothetical protein